MSSLAVTLTKHSGLGNDFLVLEVPAEQVADWPANARALCNRQSGIGADGLLLLSKIDDSNLTMRLYNSDGSLAEMSGNGIRCLAKLHTCCTAIREMWTTWWQLMQAHAALKCSA